MKSNKRPRTTQLNREINDVLAKRPLKRSRLSSAVADAFASMVDNAEVYGAENLVLAQRALGYTGDRMEFRFSDIFARQFPSAKYELLVDYIDEYRRHPHDRLGRKLTDREAAQMGNEARKIYDEEVAHIRGKIG